MLFLINIGALVCLVNSHTVFVSESPTSPPSFPYFPVSIQNEDGDHRCIGNIVHRRYVLTTCRCMTVSNGTILRLLDQRRSREKVVLLYQTHVPDRKFQSIVTAKVKKVYLHPRCVKRDYFYLNDIAVVWTEAEIDNIQNFDILEFFPVKIGIGQIIFLAWNNSQVLISNFIATTVVIVANRTSRAECIQLVCERRTSWVGCETTLKALSCLRTTDDVCELNFEGSAVFSKYGSLYYAEGLMPFAFYSDETCNRGYLGTILFTPLSDDDSFIYDVVTGRIGLLDSNPLRNRAVRAPITFFETTVMITTLCLFKQMV